MYGITLSFKVSVWTIVILRLVFVLQFQSFLAFLFVPCIETEFQHFLSLSVFVDAIT